MFSVVTPLYNKALSIGNTIQSVLDQNFSDFELLIVNDGSTDDSIKIVKKFTDPRIRLINQSNQGVSSARNTGIKEARHDWIAFLDADDLWRVDHLHNLAYLINEYPDDKVFCTSYIKSNDTFPICQNNSIVLIDNYFKEVLKENFFWTSVVCLHNSVFRNVGQFDTRLSRGEDMELWTRIARKYRIVRSNKVTAIYRTEAENRSNLFFNLKKSRVYLYDFKTSINNYETIYYKQYIVKVLRGLLKNRDIASFFKLWMRHLKYIKLYDIIKR